MRILMMNLLYPPSQFGGAEKAVGSLAEAFAKRGDHVAVICLHRGDDEISEQRNGVFVYRLPLDNLFWPLDASAKHGVVSKFIWHCKDIWNGRAAKRVGRILDQEHPDVVHTHGLNGLSVAVWKQVKERNIRLVHTMHDYYLLCVRCALFRNGRLCESPCLPCRALTQLPKAWSAKVDAVASVSKFILDAHTRLGCFEGVSAEVVYNINPQPLTSMHSAESRTDGGRLVFGFIGRVCEEKGIEVLLQAVGRLCRTDWELRVAGTGTDHYVEQLKRQFPSAQLKWLGHTSSDDFYASVDVVVLPSVWHDPLPYVMIEALGAGKSIICSRAGGMTEMAALGKKVETYPPTDVDSLARIMQAVLEAKSEWRSGGFVTPEAAQRFTENVVVNKYMKIYTKTDIQETIA